MGTAQGGYGGGAMGGSSNYGNTAFANNPSGGGYGPNGTNQLVGYSGQPYGGGMSQQPAYGMGTGGQYSPQLRQAQTAWQQQYATGEGMTPSQRQMAGLEPYPGSDQPLQRGPPGPPLDPAAVAKSWQDRGLQQPMLQNPRQPYGMGAQGMGNAYGYGGQQGNPWADTGRLTFQTPEQLAQSAMEKANNPWLNNSYAFGAQPMPQQAQGSTSFSPPPVSQPQAPLQAPRPAAPPPPAAPTRANYSPNNPFAGMYTTPQGDAWEQQQRGGAAPVAAPTPAAPAPAAPGTDVMRKALAAGVPNQGTNPGYGYGTPGGYQLDTAPSTLDPGSMNALLGIMGGNINGVGYPTSAANYANWYQQTYGTQAPGGPRAYPF
jgi:hypothetical protein